MSGNLTGLCLYIIFTIAGRICNANVSIFVSKLTVVQLNLKYTLLVILLLAYSMLHFSKSPLTYWLENLPVTLDSVCEREREREGERGRGGRGRERERASNEKGSLLPKKLSALPPALKITLVFFYFQHFYSKHIILLHIAYGFSVFSHK